VGSGVLLVKGLISNELLSGRHGVAAKLESFETLLFGSQAAGGFDFELFNGGLGGANLVELRSGDGGADGVELSALLGGKIRGGKPGIDLSELGSVGLFLVAEPDAFGFDLREGLVEGRNPLRLNVDAGLEKLEPQLPDFGEGVAGDGTWVGLGLQVHAQGES